MNLNKICETLSEIQVNNQEQKEALDYAIDCVKKEIPQSVIVNTSDMDENYNDYNYLCPLCNCGIFDENETTGRCDCGQLIIIPSLDSWLEGFKKTHKWSNKKQTWVLLENEERKE